MAFGRLGSAARARVRGHRRRRGEGRGRRALGPVPALRAPRPHRRRRGARGRLQAGGRRALPRPRHGGRARALREVPGRPRLGDARRSRRGSTRSAGATPACTCRNASAAAQLPDIRAVDLQARSHGARALAVADPDLRHGGCPGAGRAGPALPQPARLCAADPVPRLRASLRMPELLGLAGRAPLPARARLPSLRPHGAAARRLRRLRQPRLARLLRAGRRAHRRGGRDALSRQAQHRPVERLPRRHGAPAPGTHGASPTASSTSSSARSWSPRATTSRR